MAPLFHVKDFVVYKLACLLSAGGIDLYTQKGKIKVTNTLESRLELLGGQVMKSYHILVLLYYLLL